MAITDHEPDAHLIAAAPELLVALKWALAAMDRGDGVLEYTGDIAEGERAKAAIAKADGESDDSVSRLFEQAIPRYI